ncbi:uncharacterized protein [Lolium perenne]|uniref:uncharacterized protein isoform X2 n=1 Tax=Lolium perenne TaxID=4522 RepID=UPI0021F51881|nr:uncharacterized protein LOC127322084 isoform X2 [Lolium perenne]
MPRFLAVVLIYSNRAQLDDPDLMEHFISGLQITVHRRQQDDLRVLQPHVKLGRQGTAAGGRVPVQLLQTANGPAEKDWKSYCSVIKWKSVPKQDIPYLAIYLPSNYRILQWRNIANKLWVGDGSTLCISVTFYVADLISIMFLQNLELTIQQIRKQGMTYILDRDTHFEWSSYSGKPVQYSFFYIWRIGFILMYATRWMEEIDQCLSFDFLSQKIRFHCQNQLSCSFQNGIIGIRASDSN